ncbi:hypothetical protein PCL_09815 [Purpureocillium lilacinum]|uniref:Uncharacterized protein n=1 Tax=Purpureocillium lilacinum TaxID=33203 RepID=A0A2U3EEC3_PURLI|nr:hypothetical protein PCL_09815 [Purpureocillium lilacinum]
MCSFARGWGHDDYDDDDDAGDKVVDEKSDAALSTAADKGKQVSMFTTPYYEAPSGLTARRARPRADSAEHGTGGGRPRPDPRPRAVGGGDTKTLRRESIPDPDPDPDGF